MNTSHIDLVRRNFIAKAAYYAQLGLSGATFTETEILAVVDSGLPSDTFNVIVPKTADKDALTEPLRSYLDKFTGNHFPVAVWCWSDILSVEITQLLAQCGLQSDENDVAMWLELQNAIRTQPVEQSLEIRLVQTPDDYDLFADVIAELFGDSPEADQVRAYHQKIGNVHTANKSMKLHIGLIENEAVTTGTLFLDNSLAGIYDIATRPAWRGRGFGSQMFQHLLWLAQQHSATQAVLQASADGISIYKRAGFAEAGLVQVFSNRHLNA